jgi:hypothetical protein
MKASRAIVVAALIVGATGTPLASGPAVPIPDRARGAERVVVASVADSNATFETNEFGDQLIVSHVTLAVQESLKGKSEPSVEIDVLGGTVGDLTYEVSSLPKLARGERAVFFLARDKWSGKLVPHLRGQGILKLDADNRVKGSSLDLHTIKSLVASVADR